MFIDKAKIIIKAGNGGNGLVSFRREKYVAAGGPDGGDGGRGGNVLFVVDPAISTLMDFRYKRKYIAQNGEDGRTGKCFGKNGEDLTIKVPPGTLVKDANTGKIIVDMADSTEPKIIARGGNGGWGNSHFATPTRQAPRFAKSGIPGEEREVILEIKMIADVGLLGFPNVGKSTLLTAVTSATPKIANYHFTTLNPNLGVVELSEMGSFVLADIPGIIEGASEGVGLGHEFLRHIERTRLLIHVVDVSGIEGRNPIEDFDTINNELKNYSIDLTQTPQIIAANKTDIIQDNEKYTQFLEEMNKRGLKVFSISAAIKKGTDDLVRHVLGELSKLPKVKVFESEINVDIDNDYEEELFTVRRENDVYVVEGRWAQNLIGSVNFEDQESINYFQRALRRNGVIDALEDMGINEGDTVRIYDLEFDFVK